MLPNPGKCLSLTILLFTFVFPDLKGSQWQKKQMRLFFRVGGSINFETNKTNEFLAITYNKF